MRDKHTERRRFLRLLALGAGSAAIGWGSGAALAQTGSRLVVAKPLPKPSVPVKRLPMIAIDPGHGGIDPGAIGVSGVYEKEIVFDTAVELVRLLEATHRFRVMLTRRNDDFVALRERVARARARNADLFLSLHADALPDSDMRGLSVFTLSSEA